MKLSIAAAFALLTAVAQCAPAGVPTLAARQFAAQITFQGAADAAFSQSFPGDGTVVPISTYQLPGSRSSLLAPSGLYLARQSVDDFV